MMWVMMARMEQTITTRGNGSAYAAPDAMRLSVSVVNRESTVSLALAATARGVATAGEVARKHTESTQISSSGLSVWPDQDKGGRRADFQARHSLQIYCPGLDSAGDLVTALAEALGSAIQVDHIELVITDPGPLETAARKDAFHDARAKAEELAALADLTLGGAVAVVEGGGSEGLGLVRMLAASGGDSTRFEAGSQAVSASVTVSWSAR
ncbi:MAG: hypothetical protein JWR35_631 [Marmoricola sp.]|nr:hypothetical protein [Marmoricola sp.]